MRPRDEVSVCVHIFVCVDDRKEYGGFTLFTILCDEYAFTHWILVNPIIMIMMIPAYVQRVYLIIYIMREANNRVIATIHTHTPITYICTHTPIICIWIIIQFMTSHRVYGVAFCVCLCAHMCAISTFIPKIGPTTPHVAHRSHIPPNIHCMPYISPTANASGAVTNGIRYDASSNLSTTPLTTTQSQFYMSMCHGRSSKYTNIYIEVSTRVEILL